ncbi:hypothetical protein EOG74_05075 [Salmonella enterica]|nr:hypothetical protein [Salmonella enterica]
MLVIGLLFFCCILALWKTWCIYITHALLLFRYLYFLFFIYLISVVIFYLYKDKIFFCTIISLFNDLLGCYILFVWFIVFVFLLFLVLCVVFLFFISLKDRYYVFSQN